MEESTEEQKLYSALSKWKKWAETYVGLVPIADSAGTGCFFAFDYRNSKESPTVVFVDVEEDPDDEYAILFVAENLSSVIASLI